MQIDSNINSADLLSVTREYIQKKDFRNAGICCRELNSKFPGSAEGWFLTSLLSIHTGSPKLSLDSIDKALNINPENEHWLLHKIHLLMHLGNKSEALDLAIKTSDLAISDPMTLNELGLFFNKANLIQKSKKLYQKALALAPESDKIYFNLALAHNFLGEIEQAERACDNAIKLNKHHYYAHFLRSGLKRQTTSDNHIGELQELLKEPIHDPTGKTQLHYALAKEFEDCKNFTSSFEIRKKGADIYRKSINYDLKSDLSFIDKIIETYNHDQSATKDTGYDNSEPIFILGLPRSGSTLVERIISSHDSVKSAGELTNFTHLLINMMQQISPSQHLSRTGMVKLSSQLDFRQLGYSYIQSTRPSTGNTPCFIDKFPQNSLYIGLILKALPKSKIILVERHPLDVCYAMYKQLFTGIYQFSYNLDELADYYMAHQNLMTHWLTLLPENIHVVHYEKLIENIETETRKLLTFCDLEWQSECMAFHKNQQATTTASASQVRQKLYSSSMGLWKNYEHELEPLIDKLNKNNFL